MPVQYLGRSCCVWCGDAIVVLQAQYLIFEKMREEGFMSGSDDVRLTVEIVVASSQVGRIIGKGGQNVRELQRVTGSLIKLPEQPQQPGQQPDHDTTVHIVGPFYSVQVNTIYIKHFTTIKQHLKFQTPCA